MDFDDSWAPIGQSSPYVPVLISRIAEHSPELVLQIQHYLKENGEDLGARRTYDGTDASARLSLMLIEALLSFEQIRIELLDQSRTHPLLPAHLTLAMSEALQLEPALLHIAKSAFQMHLYVWNAHEGANRDIEDEESEEDDSDDINIPPGRWSGKS